MVTSAPRAPASTQPRRPSREVWLLLVIIALGLALRLYKLGDIPNGMHPDEAHYSLDAVAIRDGWRPVFLERNNGREPLFVYFMAGLFALVEPTLWSARLAGAIVGTLMIPAQYLLVSRLPLPRPRETALLSAVLVAVTFWPVSQSHQALRAGLLPVLAALVGWAWWETLQTEGWRAYVWAVVTGVLLAAGLWTHLSARLLPFVLIVSAVWVAWRTRRRQPLLHVTLTLGLAGLLVLPLALYFVENPTMMGLRTNQVSVLNPEVNQGNLLGTLLDNAWRIALMVNVRGTTSWLENLRGRPVFDPLVGIAFLVGLVFLLRDLAGRRGWRPHLAAVVLFLGGLAMLAPSWLSAGAPSYGRLNGAWAVIFLLPAWGLERGMAWLMAKGSPRLAGLAVGLILAVSAVWSAWDFFVVYAQAPDVYRVYFGPALERGRQIAQLVTEGPTYVSPAAWNQAVIRFTNVQQPPVAFEPRQGIVLPPTGAAQYAFDPADAGLANDFAKQWPALQRMESRDSTGQVSLILFRLAATDRPRLNTATPTLPSFGDAIQLDAYTLSQRVAPGKTLTLSLDWRVLRPTPVDHNLFIRVVAATGHDVGQYDGPPLGGLYPTHLWRPGEHIIHRYEMPIAKDAPPGPALVRLGWYNWRTGERLPVEGDEDAAIEIKGLEIGD